MARRDGGAAAVLLLLAVLSVLAGCISSKDVSCGRHRAGTCAACPQGNGAAWCNGDCTWVDGACTNKYVCPNLAGRQCILPHTLSSSPLCLCSSCPSAPWLYYCVRYASAQVRPYAGRAQRNRAPHLLCAVRLEQLVRTAREDTGQLVALWVRCHPHHLCTSAPLHLRL